MIAFAISAGVAFGVFSFAPASKILYIKNSPLYLAAADALQTENSANGSIPVIKIPKNLTENFAASLAEDLISKNSGSKTGETRSERGLVAPNAKAMAEKFIADGLELANKNILNFNPPNLKISSDGGKTAIENYLSESQAIINDSLRPGISIFSVLEEINKNNGAGLEKILPIISGHEAAAGQLEKKPVPDNLKDLMTEEIRLLRITANILRALTNIENDPLGAIAATKQFEAILQNWRDLQNKFDLFIQKLNQG